jgi:hypothetical protein
VVTAAEIEDGIARLGDVRAGSAGANIVLDPFVTLPPGVSIGLLTRYLIHNLSVILSATQLFYRRH